MYKEELTVIKEKENQLKARLNDIIKEIGHKADIKRDISAEFINRNMVDARGSLGASWVFMQQLDVNTLGDSEEDIRFLFLFSFALNKALENAKITDFAINLEEYFTKLEIEKWSEYKESVKSKNIFPLVFENVQEVTQGKIWQGLLSAQQLHQLSDDNMLVYNFRTQRNPVITSYGERINMDTGKVNEIKERLIAGDQFPDPIILNILNNGESSFNYNERNKTLTVFDGSIINLVDGFHRKTASSLAVETNPNLNFNWQITFTFLSEKAAHDYMSQKDKQKPMRKEWIKQMDYTLPENLCVDAIIDDKLSELAKVMKDSDEYIKFEKALTKKSIVATAIKEKYAEQIKISSNIRSTARWIVEVTDYLMGLYTDEFIVKPYEVKKTSYINNKNMFYGYIALSAKLQGNKNWKELLKQKMELIDFSKQASTWREIGLSDDKDVNKSTRNKIYNLFERGL